MDVLVAGVAETSEDHLSVSLLPPVGDPGLLPQLICQQIFQQPIRLGGESALLVVLDECVVAVLVVLGDNVPDKTGEVATPVLSVEDLLEVLPPPLVYQLQVVVPLVQQLPLHFVELFLLGQDACQD